MPLVSPTERRHFEELLAWAGFSALDFDLIETPAPMNGTGARMGPAGWVTVNRLSTQEGRTYEAREPPLWLNSFKQHLDGGAFGQP